MKLRTANILAAIVCILVGVFLLVYPGATLNTAADIIGWALIIIGALGVLSFAVHRERRSVPALVKAGLEILLGVFVLSNTASVISFFPMICGAIIAISGLVSLIDAFALPAGKARTLSVILAAITVAAGVLIFANPFSAAELTLRIIGAVLIYNGTVNLFALLKK